jgi:hypothetical protein
MTKFKIILREEGSNYVLRLKRKGFLFYKTVQEIKEQIENYSPLNQLKYNKFHKIITDWQNEFSVADDDIEIID